jgi:hypothetical protein
MANELAWSDFSVITSLLDECESSTKSLFIKLVDLNNEKVKIVDDQERLDGITEIINIHPDWTVADISARINAMKQLGIYINQNNLD